MALKSVNDSIRPYGIISTLLVFGAMPRLGLPTYPYTPDNAKRARAVRKATTSMTILFAKRQVKDAKAQLNRRTVSLILGTPIGSPSMVFCDPSTRQNRRWEGPYIILYIDEGSVTLLMTKGPTRFRTTHLNTYLIEEGSSSAENSLPGTPDNNGFISLEVEREPERESNNSTNTDQNANRKSTDGYTTNQRYCSAENEILVDMGYLDDYVFSILDEHILQHEGYIIHNNEPSTFIHPTLISDVDDLSLRDHYNPTPPPITEEEVYAERTVLPANYDCY